ncbi:translocator protein-like [Homalodisca vitripennis]|uniref:translocator protein-like n=1 Tax=Homalodisca vitripennis TaxID=197043 RepID=UPI001EE9C4B9|nr:translocator protein-like [Homalodisca vitripennis]XP_046667092.1 translocator protein-like [Homalodisca vitripennis]XP_046667093.1 translocator protein-like [Homalodisca vitripennis]XP_046667094.1 translocator protein-like [Homalodisca vitripennis]
MSASVLPLIGAIALPLGGGQLVDYIVGSGRSAWSQALKAPSWRPPAVAFPIIWSSLYCGMGYASYLVWSEGGGFTGHAKLPLAMYCLQLGLNFAWTPIFFSMRSLKGALIDIALLDVAVVGTTYLFYQVTPMAGYLMMPYLAWLTAATALNYAIWRDNPAPSDLSKGD